ncbi:cytochrome c [Ruegeria sediminis]|uniref:Cytochrome c n=1 Tax=Ruegeria sediminis TaxID=2583820 RepID=A0ABY2WTF6_9RHOB|nr:cytochrome c [Ruegeria sediminis]TMV03385.1 cytochrome c [Ruegeria sediminis]
MNKIALLIGGVAVAGAAAFYLTRGMESAGQSGSMTGAEAQGGAIVEVSLPAEFGPLAETGKTAFDAKCAACHGANAAGVEGSGPPLVHKIYEPSHHADESFHLAVQGGVRAHHWEFGNMQPVEGLTRGDVKAIVAYVRELQRANGIN